MALNGCRTTRIYCREDCPPGRRTLPRNRVTFRSESEAIAAGYRACKVCKPNQMSGPWQPKAAGRRLPVGENPEFARKNR